MMLFLVNHFLKDGIQQGMKFLLSEKQNLEWTAYFFIHFFFKKEMLRHVKLTWSGDRYLQTPNPDQPHPGHSHFYPADPDLPLCMK